MRAGFQVPIPISPKPPPHPPPHDPHSLPPPICAPVCAQRPLRPYQNRNTPSISIFSAPSVEYTRRGSGRMKPTPPPPPSPPPLPFFLPPCPCDYSVKTAYIFPVISVSRLPRGRRRRPRIIRDRGEVLGQAEADSRPATAPMNVPKKPAFICSVGGGGGGGTSGTSSTSITSIHIQRHITDNGTPGQMQHICC